MKLQLVGPSNSAFSLAAAAQQSLNCYLETIEGGDGKNKYVLRGRPGIRLFKDLTTIYVGATVVRGQMSGGGRLFVAAGSGFFEVSEAGALVGSVHGISDADLTPVDILANGNQLFVVSSASAYCDSGMGLGLNPVAIGSGILGGKCNINGKSVTWVNAPNSVLGTSDTFDVGFTGQAFLVGAPPGPLVPYTVSGVYNPNLLALATSGGTQTNVDWRSTPAINATRGVFFDGYFIANRVNTRQFNISNLLDGGTWSGLDYAYKEGSPDNILGIWAEPPLLYLLGTETLEVWRDTGNASFPLERVDGGFSRTGLVGAWSCASIMGKLHMLSGGSYGAVTAVRMEGATPVRVSTHAVEEALKGVAPNSINSYSYVERGHWLWVLWMAGGNSWVYDATESALVGSPQWHERARWDGAAWQPYIPAVHSYLQEWGGGIGMHIVGDGLSGKLYEQSTDFFDDNGADIRCVRALPYVYQDNKRVFHHRLTLELETGTAGTPPVVTLDWSDDRGQTWGTGAGGPGSVMTLGPGVTGVYTTRYFAAQLGSSRGRVYRVTIQGQGRVALIDAVLDAEVGSS